MEVADNTMQQEKNRTAYGKALLVFIVIMALLTFFSSTINNLFLPRITTETPGSGSIMKDIKKTGSVSIKKDVSIYSPYSLKVGKVLVEVGDVVTKGQVLVEFDNSELVSSLKDEEAKLQQYILSLEKQKQNLQPSDLSSNDKSIESAQIALDKAKAKLDQVTELYEIGNETLSSVNDAKASLESAQRDYNYAVSDREKAVKNSNESIKNAELDIQNSQLNIEMQERKIDSTKDQIAVTNVTSTVNGIVSQVNINQGGTASTQNALFVIVDKDAGYKFTITVTYDESEYFAVGDTVNVSINGVKDSISCQINEVKDNENEKGVKKDVVINLPSDFEYLSSDGTSINLAGGESGTVSTRINLGSYNMMISNSALGQENGNYFVYIQKSRQGALGQEFYVQKAMVQVADQDSTRTAITSGVSPRDNIVVSTDKTLSDNDRVMVE